MRTPLRHWAFILLLAAAYLFGEIVLAAAALVAVGSGVRHPLMYGLFAPFIVWGLLCGRWAHRTTCYGVAAGLWVGAVAVALATLPPVIFPGLEGHRLAPLFLWSGSDVRVIKVLGFVLGQMSSAGTPTLGVLAARIAGGIPLPTLGAWYEAKQERHRAALSPDA
jgi:hypothetical protein